MASSPASSRNPSALLRAQAVIADAAVKTAPTVPVVLVTATETLAYAAAPTVLPVPVWCFVSLKKPGGAYTNVDPAAKLMVVYGSDWSVETVISSRAWATQAWEQELEGNANPYIAVLSGAEYGGSLSVATTLQDNALAFVISNASAGNLTGGGAGNTLTVTVLYELVTL